MCCSMPRARKGLKDKIEAGLRRQFGFEVGTVLRRVDELKAMVEADPFKGEVESAAQKLYVMLFAEDLPAGIKLKGVAGDYE